MPRRPPAPPPPRPRILLVFGTRPEAIKMAPVAGALRAAGTLDVRIAVTGQHRAMLDQVLDAFGIVPDADLDAMRPGQSPAALAARLLPALDTLFAAEAPARVLVHGDTVTTAAATLAAFYRRIPVGHVEAGLRSGDLAAPWPEEGHRRLVATLADLHFAPTPAAAAALRAEGVAAAAIHVTGNSGVDALLAMRARLAREPALAAGIDALLARFAGRRIVTVTAHRRESVGPALARIAAAAARLAQRGDVAIVLPLHPHPAVRDAIERALAGHAHIALVEPLGYAAFVRLLERSHLVLTDSGGVQEEAPGLGTPVLVLRDVTERGEGIASGHAELVGTDADHIVARAARLLDDDRAHAAMARAQARNPYGDGQAAARIARVVASAHPPA